MFACVCLYVGGLDGANWMSGVHVAVYEEDKTQLLSFYNSQFYVSNRDGDREAKVTYLSFN